MSLQVLNLLVFVGLLAALGAGCLALRRLRKRRPAADGGTEQVAEVARVRYRSQRALLQVAIGGVFLATAIFALEIEIAAHEWNDTWQRLEHRAGACGQAVRDLRDVCTQAVASEQPVQNQASVQ